MRLHQCAVVILLVFCTTEVILVPVEQINNEPLQEDKALIPTKDEPQAVETSSAAKPIEQESIDKLKDKLETNEEPSTGEDSEIVEGKYIFLGPDGIPTEVEYEADPKTGFVVKSFKKEQSGLKTLISSTEDLSDDVPVAEEELAEEILPGGFVRGLYTYMDADGVPATVEYEAAPDTGFVVRNFYKEKLAGTEPIKRSTEQSPNIRKSVSKRIVITSLSPEERLQKYTPEIDLLSLKHLDDRNKDNAESTTLEDSASKREGETNMKLMLPRSTIRNFQSPKTNNDSDLEEENDEDAINPSYRFGFAVDDQSRHEESDSNGNVKGSYSYVGSDGFLTKVEYEAGANKGFVIKKMTHDPINYRNSSLKPSRKSEDSPTKVLGEDKNDEVAVSKDDKMKSDISPPPSIDPIAEPPADTNVPSESRKSLSVASLEGIPQTYLESPYPFSHILMRGNYFQGQYLEPYQPERQDGFSVYGPPFAQQVERDQDAVREMAERAKHHHNKKKRPTRRPAHHTPPPKRPKAASYTKIQPDGSYAFAYKTNDSSRQESIDANGNIHYSYQFKNKRDGNTVVIFNNKVSKIAKTEESDAQETSPNHEISKDNAARPASPLLAYPIPNPTIYQPLVNQQLPEKKLYNDDMVRKVVRRVFRRVVNKNN